jgi:hypothetical protein
MNKYDFSSLNDKEFEAFVVDLLSCEFNVRIDRFKPGKDAGVDGRWFATDSREIVIQCKHWLKTGFDGLLAHINKTELAKVDRLKPARYILVTSVPLSRKNKKDLKTALAPHVKAETDIIGPENLNDVLASHNEVEQRHYKLWLSSMSSLGFILNNAIIGRSRSELSAMLETAAVYVETTDYSKALDHINKKRVIIVTGEPGVGKTTLASQLVLQHASRGFETFVLEDSLTEAEAMYKEKAKQLFYFDDFLGRTYLEAMKPKQDSHIDSFMKRISKDPSKRFVLTSRTNILNQGAVLSDLIELQQVRTYEISIGALNKMDRARILYNHMWHSDLTRDFLDELYLDGRYHEIINHANFNPRLISFILKMERVDALPATKYWEYVQRTLKNPQDVWEHCFTAQLNQDCRDLVFLTVLNGGRINETLLQESFGRLTAAKAANPGLTDHEFRIAIRHASGSVLNRTQNPHEIVYTLFNPSIADYVLRKFKTGKLWDHYFPLLRTLSALFQLEAMKRQDFFGKTAFRRVLRHIVATEQKSETIMDEFTLRLACLISEDDELSTNFVDLIHGWIVTPAPDVVIRYSEKYLELIQNSKSSTEEKVFEECIMRLLAILEGDYLPIENSEILKKTLELMSDAGLRSAHSDFRSQILTDWNYRLDEIAVNEGVLDDFDDPANAEPAKRTLKEFVSKKLSETGITLSSDELSKICSGVEIDEILKRNEERYQRKSETIVSAPSNAVAEADELQAIDDLFSRDGIADGRSRGH